MCLCVCGIYTVCGAANGEISAPQEVPKGFAWNDVLHMKRLLSRWVTLPTVYSIWSVLHIYLSTDLCTIIIDVGRLLVSLPSRTGADQRRREKSRCSASAQQEDRFPQVAREEQTRPSTSISFSVSPSESNKHLRRSSRQD